EIEERGGKPYAIPAGASDHPLGGHGFANWAHEVAAQEAELGVFFDTVVVCSVTGSTQAGMVAGFAQLEEQGGRTRRVLGIDASAKPAETREQVLRSAHRRARRGRGESAAGGAGRDWGGGTADRAADGQRDGGAAPPPRRRRRARRALPRRHLR